MHSRAAILIGKELAEIGRSISEDVQVAQSFEKNNFQWSVKIKGPRKTLWEDGLFRLAVVFDESYNHRPPTVIFITIPFHPNVDPMTGRLSIDFLDDPDKWTCDIRMGHVLETIRKVLANPQLDLAINPEAKDLFIHNRKIYNQLVKECVMVSRSIDAPLSTKVGDISDYSAEFGTILEYDDSFVDRMNTKESQKKMDNNVADVSFEDYYSTWSGIATSKPTSVSKNPHLQNIEGQASLLSVHHGVKFEEIEDHLSRQLEQHKSFVYGNFTRDKLPEAVADDKISRIEQMRRMFLSQKTPSNLSRRDWTQVSNNDQLESMSISQGQDMKARIETWELAECRQGQTALTDTQKRNSDEAGQDDIVLVAITNNEDDTSHQLLNREETAFEDKEVYELEKWANELDGELELS